MVCRKTPLVNVEEVTAKISAVVGNGQGHPLTTGNYPAYFCGDVFRVYEVGFAAHHGLGRMGPTDRESVPYTPPIPTTTITHLAAIHVYRRVHSLFFAAREILDFGRAACGWGNQPPCCIC